MGLFDRFKGKGDGRPETDGRRPEAATPEVEWATNAPPHWPKVRSPALPVPGGEPGALHPVAQIFFGARLTEAFEGSALRLAAFQRSRLTEAGILPIPFEIEDAKSHRAVFLYPEATPAAAAHWAAVEAVLRAIEEPPAVYYAPEPLPQAPPGEAARPLSPDALSRCEGEVPAGRYAMWWRYEGSAPWPSSSVGEHIRSTYEALDRIESYAWGLVLRSLDLLKEEAGRVALPEDLTVLPLTGPEETTLLLSASAEKGLRVHFHTETAPPRYAELFWKHLARFAESLKTTIRDNDLPLDEASEESPLAWWEVMENTCRGMAERGEPVELVGVVPWEGGNPWKDS